jgi:hypothetical protein
LIAAILPASASPASSACASTSANQAQVAEAMRTMYAAATTEDLDKFHAVAAPDFYAFDGGERYDGDALTKMVKSFHDRGKIFVWTVTDPHVEATCDLAWITYINRGSIKDASGTKTSPGSNPPCSKDRPASGASASSTAPACPDAPLRQQRISL